MRTFFGKRIIETLARRRCFFRASRRFAQAPAAARCPDSKMEARACHCQRRFRFCRRKGILCRLDLAKAGYVEEEFIVGGFANVYDWQADGSVSVKTPKAPYTTRILVRRPANAARFSGNVIVEILHSARRFDWPMMWGYSHDYFMENGDAWVGISTPERLRQD